MLDKLLSNRKLVLVAGLLTGSLVTAVAARHQKRKLIDTYEASIRELDWKTFRQGFRAGWNEVLNEVEYRPKDSMFYPKPVSLD